MAADDTRMTAEDAPGDDDMPDGTLRPAMLDDGQPSFPWWLPLPGLLLMLVWAAYEAAGAEEDGASMFLDTLLWPGAAIFVLTSVTTYFGWRLDLD